MNCLLVLTCERDQISRQTETEVADLTRGLASGKLTQLGTISCREYLDISAIDRAGG